MWKRISLTLIFLIVIIFFVRVVYIKATAPPLGSHFPQKINPPSVYVDIMIEGNLTIENGCLRVRQKNTDGNGFLLIWDPRFSTRTEQGVVQVIDSSTDEVLAKVGDLVVIGDGGDLAKPTWLSLKMSIPNECTGPYWVVGEYIKKIDEP